MLQIRQLCIASVLLVSGVASAASVRLQVEGLSGELEKNVRAQLSTIQSDEVTPDRRFRARVDDAIREGLKAAGERASGADRQSHARRTGAHWRH